MKREKLPARRIRILIAIMVFWALAIAARLYFLQVVESAYYIKKAGQQQYKSIRTTSRRGDIFDRNGNVLASSVEFDSVIAHPNEMKDPVGTARILARLTGKPRDAMVRKLDPSEHWVWVKREITRAERIEIEKAKLQGVEIGKEFRRVYPKRDMASHLLGYTDIDDEGRTGLEGHYNSVIRGEPGKMQVLVDANGHAYHRQEQAPQPGASLITTIDSQIQFIVQDEMLKLVEKTNAAAISIIVMDPNSGAILAMANHPTFNPNRVNGSPASSWMNSSVGLTFEPGSTFKIVPIAAALEEGVTTPDEMIYCENGAIYVHGRRIKDHDPYGWLTVREIMQNSSNVGAIKLALLLREERLKKYIDRYGFGEKTMVDLPGEVPGTVRPVSNWTKTSIASVAIGQEIAVTPLQIVSLVATVANGGTRYKPYVVQKIQDAHGGTVEIRPKGERVMSTTTAQSLRGMLEDVVTNGTAKTSQLDGYRAAGKTGTADKIDPATGRYTKYVASFAGFAPAGDPRLAIIVVVDEPKGQYYGGQVAAPSFKRIAEKALRLMSVPPDFPRDTPHYTAVPRKGSKPSTPPSSRQREFKVLDVALSPVQAEGANPSTGLGSVVVPDLYGKSLRDATTESGSLGLEPVFNGSGRVIGQSPPPGSRVKPGTRIHFQLSLR